MTRTVSTKSWLTGKRLNKSSKTSIAFLFLAHLQFWGCSSFTTKSFPEPIILNSEPVMSLRYTSSEVSIFVPIVWQEGPHAANVSVIHRNNPSSPLFQDIVFPHDSMRFMLPINIFSKDSLGNVLKVEPVGGYRAVHHFFSAPTEKVFEFPTISIP